MRWLRGIVILLAVSLGGAAVSLDLSTIVLPSEDEALEALESGDISYYQYLQLREIIAYGIDSTSLHLLDEIPNLVYLRPSNRSLSDPVESEQRTGVAGWVAATASAAALVTGRLRYRFYQQLDETERTWYRTFGNLVVAGSFPVRFQVDREKSGRERVVSRSLGYSESSGLVRRLVLGSFTTRLGLGTLFGHAGKRFDYAHDLSNESLLYPDYGGYNGVLIDARPGKWKMTGLVSVQRDAAHRMLSVGMMTQLSDSRFAPGLIIGVNRLVNRATEKTLTVPMFGLISEHRYAAGYLAVEADRQTGGQVSAGSVVIEGRHRFKSAEARYSGWSYSDGLVDLTAGSKSAYISRTDTLLPVDMTVSTRRPGQSGLLVKTVVALSHRVKFSNALLFAGRTGGYRRQEFSTSLIHTSENRLSLLVTYLGKLKRVPKGADSEEADHRVRLEGRFLTDRSSFRCYIGYDAAPGNRGHASLFGSVRYNLPNDSRVYLWSNFGDVGSDGIRYWYLFVQAEWPIVDRLRAAAKLANNYRRERTDKHRTQLSLELQADL